MIRKLTGKVVGKTEQTVVVEVNGVGYLVNVPRIIDAAIGAELSLHTHLAVRENAMDLYGFSTIDELELFEHLLTLPKIGPKSALQVMAQADLELIKTAVANNDPSRLSKMSGMGKKTAEKVVLGLIEIYEKQGLMIMIEETIGTVGGSELSDTIDALVALGYQEHDARKTVQFVVEKNPELNDTNQLLKEALKQLS